MLILTEDRAVEAVSEYRIELEPLYRLILPEQPTVQMLKDKALFQAFAERQNLRVPRALSIRKYADLGGLRKLSLPMVVKPADKTLASDDSDQRVIFADSYSVAEEAARVKLAAVGEVLVQEWIDGADSDIYFVLFFCDRQSHPRAFFCGRKLVYNPPLVGSTAICVEAINEAERLTDLTRAFLACTHYQGLGSLEFKHDRRTGEFVIVEPTVGRTDWQEEIATLCGTNLPLIAYSFLLTDAPVELEAFWPLNERSLCPSMRTVWRSSMRYSLPPRLPRDKRVHDGYFRQTDPLPALSHLLFEESWSLRRLLRVAVRRL